MRTPHVRSPRLVSSFRRVPTNPGTADLFGLTGVAGVVEAAPANSVTVQVSATFPIGASESVLRATLQRFKDAGCHIIIMFTSRSGMAGWSHAGQSYPPTVPNVLIAFIFTTHTTQYNLGQALQIFLVLLFTTLIHPLPSVHSHARAHSHSERCRVLAMAHDLGMYGRRWVAEPPVPGATPRSAYIWINAAEAFTCYSGNVPLSPLDQQKVR